MTSRTRYFVIASLLVLCIGLGTGLVAYYVGFPGTGTRTAGPAELRYLPKDAAVIAYADVRSVMSSDVRRKVHPLATTNGQREFQEHTGIDIEHDIERVVACLEPHAGGAPTGLVLARGRFDAAKIEALMRDHGARIDDVRGKRLITAEFGGPGRDGFALSFVEPGLAAIGSPEMVRRLMSPQPSGDNVTNNVPLMDLVRGLDGDVWAAGQFDVLRANAHIPDRVASRIPAITVFSIGATVDTALRGVVRADARDEQAAKDMRDVVQGALGMVRLSAGGRPELRALADSLTLGGSGKSIVLSFTVPTEVFDDIAAKPR